MESTLSKIIILGIGVFVVIGGVVGTMYYLQSTAVPATQSVGQTTYNPTGTSNTPVTGGSSQVQNPQQTQGAPAIEKAYTDFFAKLPAKMATFVKIDGSTGGTAANVYALYSKDVAISKQLNPDDKDFSVMVAADDLNGDGVAEALVYENLPGFCGSGGCSLDIYQVKNSKWVKIFNGIGGDGVGISTKSTAGYNDLYLSVSDGVDQRIMRYAWDGTAYQQMEMTAAWNGSVFNKAY